MIRKIIITAVFLAFCALNFYAQTDNNDASADKTDIKNKLTFRQKAKNSKTFMKFRGSVYFVWDYWFEMTDGVREKGNWKGANYSALDYTGKDDTHNTDGKGRVIGGTYGGMQFQIYADYHFIAPFLTADNPLMKKNYIKLSLHSQLSPITFNEGVSVTFSPVAFLYFQAGVLFGFGWKLLDNLAGIGINNKGKIERPGITGPHVQLWVSATFQMDLAYILPKSYQRWTHFVITTTPTLRYMAYLAVNEHQPYMYIECPGEKLNGWQFAYELLVGYRFMIHEEDTGEDDPFIKTKNKNFVLTIAFYLWLDYLNLTHYNDSLMKDSGWGSDFAYVNFGPAMQFDMPYNYFLKLFFFFANDKIYTDKTAGNRYFMDRVYEDWAVYPKWFGLFFGWNF